MDSNEQILETLSIEANNLGHGDLMARIQVGWSISNRQLDPASIYHGSPPTAGDLELPERLLSVAGLKRCGFSQERADRLFEDCLDYGMGIHHQASLNEGLAKYIYSFDLAHEVDWHKAMNTLGINNDLQASIVDPEFDDIRRMQPV